MKSLGVDLSASNTGLVGLEATGTKIPKLLFERLITFPSLTGIERATAIVTELMTAIHDVKPDKIVVEGYSLNMKNPSSVIPLVELGGLFRFMMRLDGFSWLDPRATEVKKFVFGKGTGTKDQIMLHVYKRWGHEAKDNNTADAYGLGCIGLAHNNLLPGITEEMRKVVGGLKLVSN